MASVSKKLRHIRQVRREVAPPKTTDFKRYRPIYEKILIEMKTLGGSSAMEELSTWTAERIRETGHLPEPKAVRTQGRAICSRRGLTIPEESPLRERAAETK